jgi:hypothetical protein
VIQEQWDLTRFTDPLDDGNECKVVFVLKSLCRLPMSPSEGYTEQVHHAFLSHTTDLQTLTAAIGRLYFFPPLLGV